MPISHRFLLLTLIFVAFNSIEALKRKETHIQFYMQDTLGGPNPTAVQVASRLHNHTESNDTISSMFGSVYVVDDPLTALPDSNSTEIGRAQGMYAVSSQYTELSLSMSLIFSFTSGPYNGSTFSVLGRNAFMNEVRELPIVGGTGIFRLGQGFCLARTISSYQFDAVVGYNVTIFHY